jgi:hypothetical protein
VNPLDFIQATPAAQPVDLDLVRAKLEEALALLR